MSKLLINEPPLQFSPTLAKHIGLSEAILLQQLNYWLNNPKIGVERDGYCWVYNSYTQWRDDNFPWWSVKTIQRAMLHLEELELVISCQFDKADWNHKKYYRIDEDRLAELEREWLGQNVTIDKDNLSPSNATNSDNRTRQNDMFLIKNTEITSEITTENTTPNGASLQDADEAGEDSVSDPANLEPQTKTKSKRERKPPKQDGYFRMEWVKTLPDNQQDFIRYALSVFHGHGPKWQSTMEKAIKEIFLPYGLNKSIACLMYYKDSGKDFTTAVNHAAKYIANWRWNPNEMPTLPTLDKTNASPAPTQQTFIAPNGGFYV